MMVVESHPPSRGLILPQEFFIGDCGPDCNDAETTVSGPEDAAELNIEDTGVHWGYRR